VRAQAHTKKKKKVSDLFRHVRKGSSRGGGNRERNTHIQATIISIILGTCSLILNSEEEEVDLDDEEEERGLRGGFDVIFSALLLTNATSPKIDFQFSAIQPGFQDEPVAGIVL